MHKPVIIIGAGWSGLACAITLAQQGIHVHLLEAAKQAGGRARTVQVKNFVNNHAVDNGQHIILGAYHAVLGLFKILGLKETDILERQALNLNLFSSRQSSVCLKTSFLPAPLHLIIALLTMQGLTIRERLATISMSLKLALKHYTLTQDMSVYHLLIHYKQPPHVIKTLWQPLCLATMNTPIESASAQVFLRVLKDSFSKKRSDSDLLFFKKNLSELFVDHAIEFIKQRKGLIHHATRILKIETDNQQFIIKDKDSVQQCETLVLATPAYITQKLLANMQLPDSKHASACLQPKNASLDYHYEPIYTIYLQYPPTTEFKSIMTGFFDTLSQWAIDRSICQQKGLIAVVISGSGRHTTMSHAELAHCVHKELCQCFSELPEVVDYRVIAEHRATFSCHVNIEQQRPANNTQITGLFLAGDYTNTAYPATLEGAVQSGIKAAQQIIYSRSK